MQRKPRDAAGARLRVAAYTLLPLLGFKTCPTSYRTIGNVHVEITRQPVGVKYIYAYPTYLGSKLVSIINLYRGLLHTSCHPSVIICKLVLPKNPTES